MAEARAKPRVALAMLALLISVLGPTAASSGAGDACASGEDAGDTLAHASTLAVPVARCEGNLSPSDTHDWYSFHGEAGDTLNVVASPVPGDTTPLLCLHRPGASEEARCAATSGAASSLRSVLDATGPWSIRVFVAFTDASRYSLSVSLREQVVTGTIMVGNPAIGRAPSVASQAGPAQHVALDGEWVALAAIAQAKETVHLEYEGVGPVSADADLRFYGADGELLADQPCWSARIASREQCVAPAGAAQVLVEARVGRDVAFKVTYLY